MAELLSEIEWGAPALPAVKMPEWEAYVKAEMGQVPDVSLRVSRSPWVREAMLHWPRYKPRHFDQKLADICALVTAQENACRFCYGIARAQMRLLGYSEKMITSIEREMHLAELDDRERTFVRFCRDLSRANPRPPRADCDRLIQQGFREEAVAEMAFLIANNCFVNRVSTFLAIPPMAEMEKLSRSLLGRIMRPIIARKIRSMAWVSEESEVDYDSFPGLVRALQGTPAASAVAYTLDGALRSEVLSQELKVLMFAVVARSLECKFCREETLSMARQLGFSDAEFDQALQSLESPRLSEDETKILAWTRETIHFRTGPIQRRVRELAEEVGEEELLEAVGVAALANSLVRLAVLLRG